MRLECVVDLFVRDDERCLRVTKECVLCVMRVHLHMIRVCCVFVCA